MFLPVMHERALSALTGTPDVLESLLGPLDPADRLWDARPDPDRFCLREIIAHLADYEAIWLDRIARTRHEERPVLVPVDPGRLAVANDYTHSDAAATLALFRERRASLVLLLTGMGGDNWQRAGLIGDRGPLTLEEQMALVVIHDGYHTGQVAQWLGTK